MFCLSGYIKGVWTLASGGLRSLWWNLHFTLAATVEDALKWGEILDREIDKEPPTRSSRPGEGWWGLSFASLHGGRGWFWEMVRRSSWHEGLAVVGSEKMESRMTARSLTWCWQNGGALLSKRGSTWEGAGLRKKMNSVLNILNLRDLWEIKVEVSSRQLETIHRTEAKGRFLLWKQGNERTIRERMLKEEDPKKMTEKAFPERLENQELACCHENPREGEFLKGISKGWWSVKKDGHWKVSSECRVYLSHMQFRSTRSFRFHSLLSASSPHQWLGLAGLSLPSGLVHGLSAWGRGEGVSSLVQGQCGDLSGTIEGRRQLAQGPWSPSWHWNTENIDIWAQISPEAFPLWKFLVVNHIDLNLKCQKGCRGIWEPTSWKHGCMEVRANKIVFRTFLETCASGKLSRETRGKLTLLDKKALGLIINLYSYWNINLGKQLRGRTVHLISYQAQGAGGGSCRV